ncbi:hypothetical protein [Leptolyngbya sp. FACHB-16]|uniref:hypothetical protein n=1 Tax=unclassified Leptolyngbya TaxID=2650499 RepID=UPI0016845920|nr:hypothetical protein [Leptolyngbya sp. FACHB-16]MBD2154525.1 hypothetical protein [Leptolyngbya sp. FACHB-16]
MPDRSYHVAFSPEMHLEITQEAQKRRTSVPQLLRDRLEEWKNLRNFKEEIHQTQQHLRYLDAKLDALSFLIEEIYIQFAEDEDEQHDKFVRVQKLKESLEQVKAEYLPNSLHQIGS